MGKLVVKLIESGIGLTSDAIQAARNRSSNQKSISKSPNQNSPTEPSGQFADEEIARPLVQKERVRLPASTEFRIDQHYAELPAAHEPSIHQEFAELPAVHNQEYAELSAVSESCVHQQYAELPSANEPSTHLEESQQYKSIGAESVVNPMETSTVIDSGHDLDGYKNSIYSVNIQQGFEQAEAVWTQTESVQNGRLPTYEESEWAPVALARAVETTEAQERYSDQPAIANEQPVDRSGGLTCRIVIPQFMPRTETSFNGRPYAPVLANYGICQDMFSRFLEDLEQANMGSEWLNVVSIATNISNKIPAIASFITSLLVEVAAGTATEMQTSSTANTFLDWANQEIFIPNGLYAVLVQFKDMIHGQQQEPLNMLSQKLGRTLFTTEQIEINRPVSATEFHPSSTIIKVELPQIAQLVYPGLYSGANKVIREGRAESEGIQGKLKSAGAWVQDRRENKAQDSNRPKDSACCLSARGPSGKRLVSRYNDVKHPEKNRKLLSSLSGGRIGNKPGLIERAATSIKESQDLRRIARLESSIDPREEELPRFQEERTEIHKDHLLQNIPYLMIVNRLSEEKLKHSVSLLEAIF